MCIIKFCTHPAVQDNMTISVRGESFTFCEMLTDIVISNVHTTLNEMHWASEMHWALFIKIVFVDAPPLVYLCIQNIKL